MSRPSLSKRAQPQTPGAIGLAIAAFGLLGGCRNRRFLCPQEEPKGEKEEQATAQLRQSGYPNDGFRMDRMQSKKYRSAKRNRIGFR